MQTDQTSLLYYFDYWEANYQTQGFDPEPVVRRLTEILEAETEIYMRKDPDPFDERHPSRTDPTSELGKNLKILFRKDNFMNYLVNDYLRDTYFSRLQIEKSALSLNIAACRLILVIMPGLETSAVFQAQYDQLIVRLYGWAENGEEPLRSYAVGLLGAAMDIQEIAVTFRDQNIRMLPLMLQRLRELQLKYRKYGNLSLMPTDEMNIDNNEFRPFSHLGRATQHPSSEFRTPNTSAPSSDTESDNRPFYAENSQNTQERMTQKYMIPLYPLTLAASQMLILRYLTPMGEYQEFLPYIFEHNAMDIIFNFIDKVDPKNTCLAFEALKYLASLLCHKKFSVEFLSRNGLQKLLKVPRHSTAATGVAIAFYYLAYCEEAMERICNMLPKIVQELVSYALGLLGCNHDSGRCHATMFFGLSYQFKVMLDEFDKQDGLRQLYNVISVSPILSPRNEELEEPQLNSDQENAERQIIRHVCVSLKRYFESHLFYKYTQVTRQQYPSTSQSQPPFKALKNPPEIINEQIMTLQEILPMRAVWTPVNDFLTLGGVSLFITIIAHSYDWNYSGRAETVRSALDVLNICCVMPKVHAVFCELIDIPEMTQAAGINVVLGAAEGELVADAEVQKSALSLLVNVICAPVHRASCAIGRYGSAKKKLVNKSSEELIHNVWETVRANNGIIILLQLMLVKTPITDADCIRGMACRALAGLARSETVRQIISKLPLFINGQLQTLMRDPILQEKRCEHVQFQKYALELMERVSGKPTDIDTSLANIHKANVVAQTKIQFNEQQLHMLVYQHLMDRGLVDTATALLREAKLTPAIVQKPQPTLHHHSPFQIRSNLVNRPRIRSRTLETQLNLPGPSTSAIQAQNETTPTAVETPAEFPVDPQTITPIKLIKKTQTPVSATASQTAQRSLEKQGTNDVFLAPAAPGQSKNQLLPPNTNVTLDTIITEYLANQHSLCKNPMSTCPQFDLFVPHKCPDPRPNRTSGLGVNIAARLFKRQAGFDSRKLDRKFVHSHFQVQRTLRSSDSENCFTCCDFMPNDTSIVIGCQTGEVKVFNIIDSNEDFSYPCHESYIQHVQVSRDGRMALTTNSWRSPLSILWNINKKKFYSHMQFDEEDYVEFSNLAQDKILGTKNESAVIYDIKTGQKIKTLTPKIFNQYNKNRATFCPTDELILCDGVLWDFKSGKQIHKFDKLNNTLSGVFHPNGLEVISNTEVWDLRTFHLLRTIPALDQCQLKFSPQNVIYAYNIETDANPEAENNVYDTSFKTLDSYDYSSISTTDVKRSISDLSINNTGYMIALCENQGGYDSVSESVVRIYTVGRKRMAEDEIDEEEEEMAASDDEDDYDNTDEDEFENDSSADEDNDEQEEENDDNDDSSSSESNESEDNSAFGENVDENQDGDVAMEADDGNDSWETASDDD